MRRLVLLAALALPVGCGATVDVPVPEAPSAGPSALVLPGEVVLGRPAARPQPVNGPQWRPPVYRRSKPVGSPSAGKLFNATQLPEAGRDFVSWDGVVRRVGNSPARRWGTDRLVRRIQGALRRYRLRHPEARRVLVGDLSRRNGGLIASRGESLGHASHQNGLDVDLFLPRKDGLTKPPSNAGQVDRRLAQALLDAVLAEGGVRAVFVGRSLGLRGRGGIVQPWPNHDDHLHVRIG